MRTSWPREPAAFLTQAWNSHRPRASTPHRTCESASRSRIGCQGLGACGRWLPRRLGREHAAKSEMTGCAAYAVTLSSRGSVAMAVRRCAQVRTALDNSPVLFADVFCARRTACMNRRVARRRVVGRPRSSRPLPDIAGDVETHMHDRVQIPPIKRAVGSVGVTPVSSWNPCPPPGPVVKRDRSLRANED